MIWWMVVILKLTLLPLRSLTLKSRFMQLVVLLAPRPALVWVASDPQGGGLFKA
jgi:hypothetical protein